MNCCQGGEGLGRPQALPQPEFHTGGLPLSRFKQGAGNQDSFLCPGQWAAAWRKWGGDRRDNSREGLVTMSQPLLALAQHGTCGLDSRHSLSRPGCGL